MGSATVTVTASNGRLTAMQDIAVTVEAAPRTAQTLVKISGDNQQGPPGEALLSPFIVEVRDIENRVLEGVDVTFTVTAGGGILSESTVTTGANGQAANQLTLGNSIGKNTVRVSIEGIFQTVTFNAVAGDGVNIPDPNLRAKIEEALGKASYAPITVAEMATLTELEAQNANISDLTGLEFATNLTVLGLDGKIEGTNSNSVSDLSPVANLTRLKSLWLADNLISDLSPLVGLTDLTQVGLSRNSLSDLSPLVENTGLGSGDGVYVKGNPLSYPSINTHIPVLQRRGITVHFNNRTPTTLLKISGDDQRGAPSAALGQPFIVEVQDWNDEVFEGVPVTFAVTKGGGTLSATSTMTDANGRAESWLTLGLDIGAHTVEASVLEIQEPVTFNNTVVGNAVHLPDPNLRAAVETVLGKASGALITAADMATLPSIEARNANISDLTGLEFATNLKSLWLGGEEVVAST